MESKDRVCIDNLTINAKVGIFEWEAQTLQPLVFSVCVEPRYDFSQVKQDINKAVNYAELNEQIENFVQSKRHYTLESLIDELANSLFQKFDITRLKLSISKPQALKNGIASVKISRKKYD